MKRPRSQRLVIALLLLIMTATASAQPRANRAGDDRKAPASRAPLSPFSPDSLWKTPIGGNPTIDAHSLDKISFWLRYSLRSPNVAIHTFGSAVVQASPSDPVYAIRCIVYECNLNRWGPVPIRKDAKPDAGTDGNLAVWDPVTHREWDFWVSRCPMDCGRTSSGGAFSTDGYGAGGARGSNAAHFPELGGLLRPEEIARGRIDHALTFSQVGAGRGHVWPATHDDGDLSHPLALKQGTHLQLDPAINVAALPLHPWEKVVGVALQEYGMYQRDKGGSFAIKAENPVNRPSDPWISLGMKDNPRFSPAFPWARLRVLAPGSRRIGTRGNDVVDGTPGADLIFGLSGDDVMRGMAGSDVLYGGKGDDRIAGSEGDDRLSAEIGNDHLYGGEGDDVLVGGSGDDLLYGGSGENRYSGGPGNDTIDSANGRKETVDCGAGRDTARADETDRLLKCERRLLPSRGVGSAVG